MDQNSANPTDPNQKPQEPVIPITPSTPPNPAPPQAPQQTPAQPVTAPQPENAPVPPHEPDRPQPTVGGPFAKATTPPQTVSVQAIPLGPDDAKGHNGHGGRKKKMLFIGAAVVSIVLFIAGIYGFTSKMYTSSTETEAKMNKMKYDYSTEQKKMQSTPTPTPTPGVDQQLDSLDAELKKVDTDTDAADAGITDKMEDLN